MKSSEQIIEKLKSVVSALKIFSALILSLELIFVMVIGVASSNIYHLEYSVFYKWLLFVTVIFYVVLKVSTYIYSKNLPSSIYQSLQNSIKYESILSEKSRVLLINSILTKVIDNISKIDPKDFAIDYLNRVKKKSDNSKESVDSLSHVHELEENMMNIFRPFVDQLGFLFNRPEGKFTIGVYYKYKGKTEINNKIIPSVMILRDDMKVKSLIKSVYDSDFNDYKGIRLQVYNSLQSCIQNLRYEITDVKDYKNSIIISNPVISDKGLMNQKGALFIICNLDQEDIPSDLQSIIELFSKCLEILTEKLTIGGMSSGVVNLVKSIFTIPEKIRETIDKTDPEKFNKLVDSQTDDSNQVNTSKKDLED